MKINMFISRVLSLILSFQFVIAPVHASEDQSIQPAAQVSFGLPNEGHLDAFHKASDAKYANKQVQMEYALYSLRNVTVMKLLKARKALKELIGSETRLKNTAAQFNLGNASFDVPLSIKKLYKDKIVEITDDIQWLRQHNTTALNEPINFTLRKELALGLMAVSLQIIQYDNLLKYIRKDMWEQEFDNKNTRRWLRPKYTREFKLTELDAELQGKRDALLYEYHILAVEIDKAPLYKHLYHALEKHFGFPNSQMVQYVEGSVFEKFPLALPTTLEDAINDKIDSDFTKEKERLLFVKVDSIIEQALVISFVNNTDALKTLSTPINFKDDEDVFLYLANNEFMWEETKNYYNYLGDEVNFDKGFIEAYLKNDIKKAKNEAVHKVTFQSALALAAGSLILTGGASMGIIGPTMGAVGTGVGTATAYGMAAKSVYDYAEAKQYAGYAQNFFYGSKDLSSSAEVKGAIELEDSAYRTMIFSIVLAGAPKAVIGALSRGRQLVTRGQQVLVRLHPQEWRQIEELLARTGERLARFGRFGTRLLSRAQAIVGRNQTMGQRLNQLEDTFGAVGRRFGTTGAKVKEIIKNHPKTKDFYKMIADKESRRIYLVDLFSDISIALGTEIAARRDKFDDEFQYVLLNVIITVWLITALNLKSVTRTGDASPKMFDPGLTGQERWEAFYKPGIDLGKLTAKVTLVSSAAVEVYDHLKDPNKEEVSDRVSRVLWTTALFGLWLGISSNLRAQALSGWYIPNNTRQAGRAILKGQGILNPTDDQILNAGLQSKKQIAKNFAIGFGNNAFGTVATTLMAKYLIQDKDAASEEDLQSVHMRFMPDNGHAAYLFGFLDKQEELF